MACTFPRGLRPCPSHVPVLAHSTFFSLRSRAVHALFRAKPVVWAKKWMGSFPFTLTVVKGHFLCPVHFKGNPNGRSIAGTVNYTGMGKTKTHTRFSLDLSSCSLKISVWKSRKQTVSTAFFSFFLVSTAFFLLLFFAEQSVSVTS